MTQEHPFKVGESYLFRTVTHYWLGRVVEIAGPFLKLEPAAWVADTGRFHKATTVESLSEVEVVTVPAYVNTEAVVDAIEWHSELATESK